MAAFTEKSGGRWFEFWTVDSDNLPAGFDLDLQWGKQRDATHVVLTAPSRLDDPNMSAYRFAKVLKTVAYIGVDELDGGGIKWEKWQIRRH